MKWYEKEQWRQAVSDEDYRERLSNNSKELDAEVLKVGKGPRVRKDAMPQLSVSFMVGKLKEFAVSSTHKELDRIQSEFTTQASSHAPNKPVHPPPQTPHLLVSCPRSMLLTGRCNRNSPRDANLTGLTGRVRLVTGEWPAARLRMATPPSHQRARPVS